MRALKILVVVMGVMLVAGTVALVMAIASRLGHLSPSVPSAASPTASTVDLPVGARIVASEASGDRLVVRIAFANGSEELLVFNLASGARIATITLRAVPAAP
jgi:Family of unknown function (DUF6476)